MVNVRQLSLLFAVSAVTSLASSDLYLERFFSVSGTNFFFKFQDADIGSSNMMRIADDIIAIRDFGITGEIRLHSFNGHDGYIYNNNLIDSPYNRSDMVDFPRDFDIVNTTNCLFVPKTLSDAYTNAFVFLDSNTNMYRSSIAFVNSLKPGNLDGVNSNEVCRLVYQPGLDVSIYAQCRDEIIGDLKKQRYGFPSALSFFQTGPGTNGFPYAATWMRIPCSYWSSLDRGNVISTFFAIWHEGLWRLSPTGW